MQEIVHTVLKLGAAADFRLWLRLYGCGGARVAKNKNENKKLKKKKLLSPRINKRKSEETTAKHTHTHTLLQRHPAFLGRRRWFFTTVGEDYLGLVADFRGLFAYHRDGDRFVRVLSLVEGKQAAPFNVDVVVQQQVV